MCVINFTFHNRCGAQLYRTPTHIYLLPALPLRPFIAHYTLCPESGGFTAESEGALTLIPDASGCFVLTLNAAGLTGKLYGPTTETVTIPRGAESSPPRFFVEFKPGGLFTFLGIPQHELRDRVWPMGDICPALLARFASLAQTAPDLDAFAAGVDGILRAQTRAESTAVPMLAYLTTRRGTIADLAQDTAYSPRHLSRLFAEGAGMGCKSFLRIVRVNGAVRRMGAGATSLTALAQELNYYDQSHFIHDFKSICGVSPGEYRASLSDFYNEPLKF